MRSRAPAVLAAVLVAAAAPTLGACGGDSAGDVAPKSTPTLTLPSGADALAQEGGGDGATSTTSTTSTTDTTDTTTDGAAPQVPAPTTTQAAPTPTQTQAPPASTAGGASPQTEEPSGGSDSGTTGSGGGTGGAGDFNQFCQDNPGACPGN